MDLEGRSSQKIRMLIMQLDGGGMDYFTDTPCGARILRKKKAFLKKISSSLTCKQQI